MCGLDSIKGSDNNGLEGGVNLSGGTTNLSFDLNLGTNGITEALALKSSTGLMPSSIGGGGEQFHSLDTNNESSCDGQFEDDMQALLPNKSHHNHNSRDELNQVGGNMFKIQYC